MDVVHHSRPSPIQMKASKFIQKVSNFRPRFFSSARRSKDDKDLHHHHHHHHNPYSEHARSKSASAAATMHMHMMTGGSNSPGDMDCDDESVVVAGNNFYKPYMSQPLLNLGDMLVEPFVPEWQQDTQREPIPANVRRQQQQQQQQQQTVPVSIPPPPHASTPPHLKPSYQQQVHKKPQPQLHVQTQFSSPPVQEPQHREHEYHHHHHHHHHQHKQHAQQAAGTQEQQQQPPGPQLPLRENGHPSGEGGTAATHTGEPHVALSSRDFVISPNTLASLPTAPVSTPPPPPPPPPSQSPSARRLHKNAKRVVTGSAGSDNPPSSSPSGPPYPSPPTKSPPAPDKRDHGGGGRNDHVNGGNGQGDTVINSHKNAAIAVSSNRGGNAKKKHLGVQPATTTTMSMKSSQHQLPPPLPPKSLGGHQNGSALSSSGNSSVMVFGSRTLVDGDNDDDDNVPLINILENNHSPSHSQIQTRDDGRSAVLSPPSASIKIGSGENKDNNKEDNDTMLFQSSSPQSAPFIPVSDSGTSIDATTPVQADKEHPDIAGAIGRSATFPTVLTATTLHADHNSFQPQPEPVWASSSQSPVIDSGGLSPQIADISSSASPPPRFAYKPPRTAPSSSSGSVMRPTPKLQMPTTPPLRGSLALPHRFSYDKDGNNLRFSPTIISRHPPMPLKLPALPSLPAVNATPVSQEDSKRRSQIGLRSMPALPRKGSGRGAAGHEEEDDAEEDDMEDDMEEGIDERNGVRSHEDNLGQSLTRVDQEEPKASTSSEASVRVLSRASSYSTALDELADGHASGKRGRLEQLLPEVDTSKLDLSFFDSSPTPPKVDIKGKGKAREEVVDDMSTPTERTQKDYFSAGQSGTPGGPSLTVVVNKRASGYQTRPVSSSYRLSHTASMHTPRPAYASIKTVPLPPLADAERPGMYKHASHSMFDIHLLRPSQEQSTELEDLKDIVGGDDVEQRDFLTTPTEIEAKQRRVSKYIVDEVPSPHILRRRRSMPSYYGPSAVPPPYPDFPFSRRAPPILPREDEGREKLPGYTNDIHLKAIMPRKMEFSAPGIQAKDRKWRRMICVLEGTVFRVYRCPPSVAGVSVIEGWWERKVGVGDVSVMGSGYTTASPTTIMTGGPMRRRSASPVNVRTTTKQDGEREHETVSVRLTPPSIPAPPDMQGSQRSKRNLNLSVPFLKQTKSHGRSNSEVPQSTVMVTPPRTPRGSFSLSRTTVMMGGNISRTPSPGLSSSGLSSSATMSSGSPQAGAQFDTLGRSQTPLMMYGDEVPEPDSSTLIRSYTLQHAESGLGLDYVKRRNVIRVKMEGEQFLLQARDAAEVVAWIEGLQSATNIALDLDERPMPRGPLFPRRRRRRRL